MSMEITMTMRPIVDGEVVRLAGQEFPCDDIGDSFESFIPKQVLTGFRLSEIPEELTIKPVESAGVITNDIGLSFADGSAFVSVHVCERRKLWDGDVGLRVYMEALQQAICERADAEESDLDDDGDYILLDYNIKITEDLEIEDAIPRVEAAISEIEARAAQLVQESLMKKWQKASV
jgi:hypothetical protein